MCGIHRFEFHCVRFILIEKYLLAADHLIIWQRTKFDTEQKSPKFLPVNMTLVSSTNKIVSDTEFILSGRSFVLVLKTIEAIELILGELDVSLYPSQRKDFELY